MGLFLCEEFKGMNGNTWSGRSKIQIIKRHGVEKNKNKKSEKTRNGRKQKFKFGQMNLTSA